MISYHQLGPTTYHNLSNVMISHDKRVAGFPNCFSFFPHLPPFPPSFFCFSQIFLKKEKSKEQMKNHKKKKIHIDFRNLKKIKVKKSLKMFKKMSQLTLSPIFCIVVFTRERCETKEVVRRDVEALWKCLCPAACAKQWIQPSLLTMTRARARTTHLV